GVVEHAQHLAVGVALTQPLGKVHPLDQLHRDEVALAVAGDLVDGDDIGVAQLRERTRFAEESRAPGALATITEHLDRNLALQIGIVAGVDDGHPASAEQALDPVTPDHPRMHFGKYERSAEQRPQDLVHGDLAAHAAVLALEAEAGPCMNVGTTGSI